jgi:hypothetical protein
MPSKITYSQFQIASENLPESQNFIDYAIEFVLQPEIIAVILTTVTLVGALVITKPGKKMQNKKLPTDYSNPKSRIYIILKSFSKRE